VGRRDSRDLRRCSEDRYAVSARAIVRRRSGRPFTRTGGLIDTVKLAIPTYTHSAKGIQPSRHRALRIAVNDRLGQLDAALPPLRSPATGGSR
jgi:16S rRNA C1402 N4-methylase RsmH